MIIEKDYIMRQIQSLVQVVVRILGLKEQKKYGQALDEIDNTYARFFDEKRSTMQARNSDELEQLCTRDGHFSADLAFALADIINEEAEILEMQDKSDKAIKKYALALELYQKAVAEKDVTLPIDVMNKISRLEKKVAKK